MPFINGIGAFVETHGGSLPEIGQGEFSGGLSCYIPAQSGQQFWLRYVILQPLPCKAASVEFYVDGQRIDAQFPSLQGGPGSPKIQPLESRITSQYVQEAYNQDGTPGKIWKRDVFFTLVKVVASRSAKALMSQEQALRYGTIECRVYRGEGLPGRARAAKSEVFAPPPSELYRGFLKGRHITHVSRVGAKIETTPKRRYAVRCVDPEEAPFAWFKFHYRSREYLEKKFKDEKFRQYSAVRENSCGWSIPRHPTGSPRRTPDVQTRAKANPGTPESGPRSPIGSLEITIHKLENELAEAEQAGVEDYQLLANLREEIRKARENTERLRANTRWNNGNLQVAAQDASSYDDGDDDDDDGEDN
ncbi:hypothetical protein C7212DRAFT_363594 [Tuber magnatum]|uniref:DUF7918 domain-containing protein n=1 Tax=Tuber magnatum TaxID=42249 RepID=A0A317SQE3_9PEZI|nr:hypothetical protein C7212DRAFT_363594 [Tuber magnatum]